MTNKPQTTTEMKPTATRGRGRPPKEGANGEARPPEEIAVANLQYALDRACGFIADRNTSVAARAARCARAGIPQGKVKMALNAMREALADCEQAVERAYAAPAEKVAVTRRVDLLA